MNDSAFFLGVDGGGTKCLARLQDASGNLLAQCQTGPANPAQDAASAFAQIKLVADLLLQQAGLTTAIWDRTSAVLGLAGVNIPAYQQLAESWSLPFASWRVVSDLHIACVGAHRSEAGAVIITGTGSSAFLMHHQKPVYLGGHGFPLGDKASGAWLGWRALSLTLETLDGLHPQNQLTEAVCRQLQSSASQDIVTQTLKYRPADFAKLAPLVFFHAKSCGFSRALLEEGADYLASLVHRLNSYAPSRCAIIGGLAASWIPWLDQDVVNLLAPALQEPIDGALWLAAR